MSVIFNGTEIEKLVFNGTELDTAFYQGVEVFTSAREVTYTLTNLNQVSCPTKVKNGGTLIAQISGASGYLTPETITVTMDGVELTTTTTESSYYTYDANTGTITVYNCVGVINIVATTDLKYSTEWTFSSASVTSYLGTNIDLTIPYAYRALTRNNKTYYVVYSSAPTGTYTSVTKIGDSAFYGKTSLRSITTNRSVAIGSEAFRGCTNLQTVNLAGLSSLGKSAFYGCTSLVSINKTLSTIPDYCYYNCTSLTTIGTTSGSMSFKDVGAYAFYNCGKITGTATCNSTSTSQTVTIGNFAFSKTNISKFDFSQSKATHTFGEGCFASNTFWSITRGNYVNIKIVIATDTTSSEGGTYKYVYGAYIGDTSYAKLEGGDYVPYGYYDGYYDGVQVVHDYNDKLCGDGYVTMLDSYYALEVSNSPSVGKKIHWGISGTNSDIYKSGYANCYYVSTSKYGTSVTTRTEVGSLYTEHGTYFGVGVYGHITAQSSGCIVFDTLITLADGTQKKIQDVTYKDRILRLNHDTGEIDTSYCHWINRDETADKYYYVKFSDGSSIKFINPHAMFSLDDLCYVQVTDPKQFHVGTRVPKQVMKDGKYVLTEVTVESIDIVLETVHFCEVVTSQFFNCFANNLLISEPFTTGFQNMYGFNEDLTYKSPVRKQYLAGEYKGYLFSEDYIRDTLRIRDKDSIGFRAEEWGMLVEAKLIDERYIHNMIDDFVNNPEHKTDPFRDESGDSIWPVTNDNDIVENIDDYMMKEGSEYILPENKHANFIGWYCSADSKMYQPNDIYKVKHGTHFTAKFKQGE